MSREFRTRLPVALAAALVLAGCGNSGKPAGPAVPSETFVFISATDCAAGGNLNLDRCGEIIDKAIDAHIQKAPAYTSLKACEAVEGGERCERTDKKAFRPRLLAFAVIITGKNAVATPLYATIGGEAGFRAGDKKLFLTTEENLTFSPKALAVYETNKFEGIKSGGYQF